MAEEEEMAMRGRYGLQMGSLDRFMKQAALILNYLTEQPGGEARWRELHPSTITAGENLWRRTIKWLLEYSYIERPRRGLYRITQRGRELLESLTPFL